MSAGESGDSGGEAQFVRLRDPALPSRLSHLPDPPRGLYVRSTDVDEALTTLRDLPTVAVVGTRRASRAGLEFTREVTSELAARGVAVVSGLALGVDAAAHEGALSGGGKTIAVLGSGVDQPGPVRNSGLARRIVDRGALVSEYPPRTEAAKWRFPARNRIIAALAAVVVVIEAPSRSGSLITTDFALDMGRVVMAVPGPPWAHASRGCNALIKAGAAVCESAGDVLAEFPGYERRAGTATREAADAPDDPVVASVLGALEVEPRSLDDLAEYAGTSVVRVSSALSELEVEGFVSADGGRYRLTVRR